jgi:hypothetical protein
VAHPSTVHQLKVTLRGVRPPVRRRIVVPSDTPLSELADLLEAAMGWLGGHLHEFAAGDVTYEVPDPDGDTGWGRRTVDERTVTLGQVLDEPKAKLRWTYDFGDNWQHDVVVESIGPNEADFSGPVCVAGRRACPPEDCGGTAGYANLLAALADPDHEDHEELTEWAPPGFDPDAFDPADAIEAMRSPRPLADWDDEW